MTAKRSFKDRFRSPGVAKAMVSPLGILLFGLGTAVALLAGAPVIGALGVGAAAWAARVLVAVPRDRKPGIAPGGERIDPYTLSEPWRGYVLGAQNAKNRYDRVVAGTAGGPIRDRLRELGERLDDGIVDCWQIATRGDRIDAALGQLRTAEAEIQLARARKQVDEQGASPTLESTIGSLEAQVASSRRMKAVSSDTRDRLRLLDARLDELVARAVEVSVGASDTVAFSGEVDELVDELEALRLALEETDRAAAAGAGRPAPLPADGATGQPLAPPQPESGPAPAPPQPEQPEADRPQTWPPTG